MIYGSIINGDTYFGNRLNSDAWEDSSNSNKTKALTMATHYIDRLNYSGDRAVATQELEFPRGDDTSVPTDIEYATYEIALSLLDGKDIQAVIENLAIVVQGLSSVRTTYIRSFVLEHLRAGIPSVVAWNYLKAYLRNPNSFNFSRVK